IVDITENDYFRDPIKLRDVSKYLSLHRVLNELYYELFNVVQRFSLGTFAKLGRMIMSYNSRGFFDNEIEVKNFILGYDDLLRKSLIHVFKHSKYEQAKEELIKIIENHHLIDIEKVYKPLGTLLSIIGNDYLTLVKMIAT